MKFWIHSFIHNLFLCLFAFILICLFYSRISIPEWFCYVYSLGYLFEEVRQVYTFRRRGLTYYYLNLKKMKSDDEDVVLHPYNNPVLEQVEFSSFEVLQAFSLHDCRHKLVQTEEDKEYERQISLKLLYKRINEKYN